MHPILFRIPLPPFELKLWWALAAVVAAALAYTIGALRRQDRTGAALPLLVAAAAAGAAFKFRAVGISAPSVPIYSYGVMLGLSLVVGWYLTLHLAEKDFGADRREVLANCYVVTAVVAIVGSRVLYILTNLDEFRTIDDLLAFRRGGLVAYGGFLGGFLGSWLYMRANGLRLLPWADVAVPSLASGLMLTRIGCYLFGCDFGKPLTSSAPAWLQKLGTFPHWAEGTLEHGSGSPAWVQHVQQRGLSLDSAASLPVHPTQLYESLVGLFLLGLVFFVRRHQKFRGQVFLAFTFAYGLLRFSLEILRDDLERGEFGPMLGEHVLVPAAFALLAIGWSLGMARSVVDPTLRRLTQVASFAPALVAWLLLRPDTFADATLVRYSTSQWVGVITGVLAAVFYAVLAQAADAHPESAMLVLDGGRVAAREEAPLAAPVAAEAAPDAKPADAEADAALGDPGA